jgi:hypothetical protein
LTLTITNAGNVKVTGITLQSGVGLTCTAGADFEIAVGGSTTCRYALDQLSRTNGRMFLALLFEKA